MASAVRAWVGRHRIASFLLVTYAFTWTVQGALAWSNMEASWTHSILIGFGAFGPPVGAAVVLWASGGDLRAWVGQVFRWRIGKWWLVALGLPLVLVAVGSGIYVLFGGPADLPTLPSFGIYLFALAWGTVWGGGQEELGWRGFMLPALQEKYSALTASLLVGVAWGGWHLPLFLNATTTHGGWGLSQQVVWVVTILAGSVLWAWLYNVTGGSVLAVAVAHAGTNAMGIFHPANQPGLVLDQWTSLVAEVSSGAVLVVAAVVVVLVFGAARLSKGEVPDAATAGLTPVRRGGAN